MPGKRWNKLDIVAEEIAAGKTNVEASRIAGYPPGKSFATNAKKRAQNPYVRDRVARYRRIAANAAAISCERLIIESEEARLKAMEESKGASAAISAIICKAKLAGLWKERAEVSGPDNSPMAIAITWKRPPELAA